MAVYNGASTLTAAIESILCQHFSDWSLIVVDDGSTDGTYDLLSAYATKDPRIRALRLRENRGLAFALNFGIGETSSFLIARMDADDTSRSDRLQTQVEFLEQHREVAVLGTAAKLVSPTGGLAGVLVNPERHEDLVRQIYYRNPFIHPSVTFRRTFIEKMKGYSVDLIRAQDYDLWLRGYQLFRFQNLPLPLVEYRLQPRLSMRNAVYSSLVVRRALSREKKLISKGWYVLRPLVAYAFQSVRYGR